MAAVDRLVSLANEASLRFALVLLSLGCALSRGVFATEPDSPPEANPGRPTVSTPAALTPPGYLQFETGLLLARQSPDVASRLGFSEVIKLAVSQRLELLLGAEPFAAGPLRRVRDGDVVGGLQFVALRSEGASPTVAVSYFGRVHTGTSPDVDIGSFRQSGILLVSFETVGFHVDANAYLAEQEQDGRRRAQNGQSLSVSHPIGPFTASMELWRFSQPFLRSRAAGNLWALSYPVRKNLVVDAGFEAGLTRTSTRWEAFAGFTYLLPRRLW